MALFTSGRHLVKQSDRILKRYARKNKGKDKKFDRDYKKFRLENARAKLEGNRMRYKPKAQSKAARKNDYRTHNRKEAWYLMQEGQSLGNKKMFRQGRSQLGRHLRELVIDHRMTRKEIRGMDYVRPITNKEMKVWTRQMKELTGE